MNNIEVLEVKIFIIDDNKTKIIKSYDPSLTIEDTIWIEHNLQPEQYEILGQRVVLV